MSDLRTLDGFQDSLDKEMAWRVKEISAVNQEARKNSANQKPFIRAAVTMLYAHWEGFIKKSAENYLSYIEFKRLNYSDLQQCFVVIGLKAKISEVVDSKSMMLNISVLDFLQNEINAPARLNPSKSVYTDSNLTSTVFKNIALSINIDIGKYETKFNLIDLRLVAQRNRIAHGEFLMINGREYSELSEEILLLMRRFKTDIENAASLEAYLR